MNKVSLSENKKIKKDITPLFKKAFPKDERPPVYYFYKNIKRYNENKLFAYYDEEEFIGFTYLTFYKDIVYLFFLAVSENKRNQGYGSKILSLIKEEYKDKVILLCYEEIDEKYPDYENRKKRESFYLKNGFVSNNLKTNEFGVIFQTAYIGTHQVSFSDYQQIFRLGFSDFALKYLKKAD